LHIYLVRHGETDWNTRLLFQGQTDIPLNKTGISQARHIGAELKCKNIGAIISSDLSRAYLTAAEVKKACGIQGAIEKNNGLRERDYGALEGKKYVMLGSPRASCKVESDKKFFARVNRAFEDVLKKYKGKNIAVITHGGVVRQIVSYVLGLKDYRKLRIYNASISEIFFDADKKSFFLLLLNSVSHLSVKERNSIEYHIKGV
jgi:broad specificity phosphatase PhoE